MGIDGVRRLLGWWLFIALRNNSESREWSVDCLQEMSCLLGEDPFLPSNPLTLMNANQIHSCFFCFCSCFFFF
jgi:hypothetical protein